VEDGVAEHEEVGGREQRNGCHVDGLDGEAKQRRQQRGRSRRQAILTACDQEISTGLVTERKGELLVMAPHKQSLKREVDQQGDTKANREGDLEGKPDKVGEDQRGEQIDAGYRPSRQGIANTLPDQARLR
jgi:hypothetical protein